jgi:hypothetical protein
MKAIQFLPDKLPWPHGVVRRTWDRNSWTPGEPIKDGCYILKTGGNEYEIWPKDWVVTNDEGVRSVCKQEDFEAEGEQDLDSH